MLKHSQPGPRVGLKRSAFELVMVGMGELVSKVELAVALDEVIEFGVDLAQFDPQLAQEGEELLAPGDGFSARHVQATPLDLKRMADDAFGNVLAENNGDCLLGHLHGQTEHAPAVAQ